MGRRISKEFLHPSILEGVNNKIGNLDSLETDAKDNMVQAINELVEKLDNSAEIESGKELIANAVGEPLTAEESFDEMSNDINSLLSTFKTNMMNNGITVESGDKFKSLIDKIATMVEEGEGKGIQIVSGTLQDYVADTDTFNFFVKDSSNYTYDYASYVEIKDLSFRPSFVFINAYNEEGGGYIHNYAIVNNFNNNQYNNENNKPSVITGCSDVSSIGSGEAATYMADEKVFVDDSTIHVPLEFWSNTGSNIDYLIIGVGEEDTTLRDSLASILEEEGVSVTEEDDMASLITKVDEEFDRKNEEIENIQQNVIPIKKIIVTDTLPTTVTDDIVLLTDIPAPNIYTTQIPDDYGYNANYDNWSDVIPVEGDIVFNLAHGYNDSNTYNKIIISYDNVTITLTIMDIYQYINGEWDGSIMYKAYGNKNGVWTIINEMV